jgi:hypothetical protein
VLAHSAFTANGGNFFGEEFVGFAVELEAKPKEQGV